MILMDTCALIFDALTPQKLTTSAQKAIVDGEEKNLLYCSDISLWEVGMLIEKKRLEPGVETQVFLRLMLEARGIQVLPITIEIASLSATSNYDHYDPADRIIASTAIHHNATLITSDKKLSNIPEITITW